MYKLKNKRLALIVIAIATCALVFGCVGFLTVQATQSDKKATETIKATPDEVETYTSSPSSTVSETETTAPSTEAETEAETEPVTEKPTKKPTEAPTEKPTQKPTEKPTQKPQKAENTNIDYSTRDLLARVIYLEAGICSEHCQWLVGSTAMNLADDRGGLAAVAYDYNTFNVAYMIDGCTPSELSIKVAERILSGDRDYNVKAFRTDYYHGFGTPYTSVDNVYFSTY